MKTYSFGDWCRHWRPRNEYNSYPKFLSSSSKVTVRYVTFMRECNKCCGGRIPCWGPQKVKAQDQGKGGGAEIVSEVEESLLKSLRWVSKKKKMRRRSWLFESYMGSIPGWQRDWWSEQRTGKIWQKLTFFGMGKMKGLDMVNVENLNSYLKMLKLILKKQMTDWWKHKKLHLRM